MQDYFTKDLLSMKYGILLALITLIYGFGLGGVFGVFEDNIKGHLKSEAKEVLTTVYNGDEAQMKKISDKSWIYFKRAHLHANGLGIISLGLILLLSFLAADRRVKMITAFSLGFGSLGYSLAWMFAGLRAPGMGSTGMAKESLEWLAIPSTGLCFIGLLMVLGIVFMSFFLKREDRT